MIQNNRIGYYRNTSVVKYYNFVTPVASFDNDNIVSESVTLKENLCSEEKLTFGSCEANEISFSTNDVDGVNLVGKDLMCSTLPGNAVMGVIPINLGRYTVVEDKLSSNRLSRQIKAIDYMADILNVDVTEWYNSLTYPMTLKAFRNSFFEHIGYTQTDEQLVNDNMLVYKTIDSNQITGAMIIKPICEINGVFGKMRRQYEDNKVFKYVSLGEYSSNALYPAEDLYPSETLYPSGFTTSEYHRFDTDNYFSVDYANFVSNELGLDKLIIRQEENDVGVTVGDGTTFDNVYVVQGNFLTYGLNAEELTTVATNLYNKIKYVGYVPMTAVVRGNPCLEVGDAISIIANNRILNTYILQRTLTGMTALKDTYTSKGVEKYTEEANGLNAQINQLRGKSAKIQADVDGLSVEVEDLAESTTSRFTQTAETISAEVTRATEKEGEISASLELKVGKDENDQVVSMINASANVVSLKGNRVEIESDNFNLDRSGNVSANGTFTSVKSDDVYAQLQGNGVHIFHNTTEIGVCGGSTQDALLLRGNNAVAIGNGTNSYYYCNNGLNPTGYTERHLFNGAERHLGNVYFGTGDAHLNAIAYDGSQAVACTHGFYAYGSIGCSGTKYRIVDTEHYGKRGLNAFETPYAQFGDNGSAEIGADGTCKIEFEKIFAETIDLTKGYQVSITQTSEKSTNWVEKKDTCFIVHGDPKATFDWFVVARQRDYADVRLAEIEIPNVESEVTE